MAFSDPIAELLTGIRNSKEVKHRFLDIGLSREKLNIVKILKEKGFIRNYLVDEKRSLMRIFLKYSKRRSVINGLKRVSRPGLRKYIGYGDIPVIFGGMGMVILSTSKGIIDGKKARELKVGGELLCYVW
jgi:small subunit ribosomal protein S8